MVDLGYQCLYRSADAANYVRGMEGLIGFKLQGFVNDATRTRDLDDIRALFKIHRASLNMNEVREYFALFDQSELLHELLG